MKTGTISVSSLQIQANRCDLLGRVADDLAHEVKNPIHAAVINLEVLKRRVSNGDADAALKRIGVLQEEVSRIHQLVDGLFQLLRPSREGAHCLDFDQAIGELLPMARTVAKVARVSVRYEPAGGGLVTIRRAALRQAVWNLIANALDAMRPAEGRLELCAARAAGEVLLRVRDTGPGVHADAVTRLGVPGFTTRPEHAGLGLAVARALVEEAGGRLELEDAGGEGRGATLLLALPGTAGA